MGQRMADSDTEPVEPQRGESVVPIPAAERVPVLELGAELPLTGAVGQDGLDPDTPTLYSEADAEEDRPVDLDLGRPHRVGAWVVVVGVLALAAFFVAVPAHTYDLDFRGRAIPQTRRIELIELWRVQTRNLPDVRYQALFQFVFVACVIAFLIGSAVLIWLAMVEIRPAATPASSRDRAANATAEPAPES